MRRGEAVDELAHRVQIGQVQPAHLNAVTQFGRDLFAFPDIAACEHHARTRRSQARVVSAPSPLFAPVTTNVRPV